MAINMHYFSNEFSKTAKRWGFPSPAPLNLQFWWTEVLWFGQIVVFQVDYVTKIKSQVFFNLGTWPSSQLKFLVTLVIGKDLVPEGHVIKW